MKSLLEGVRTLLILGRVSNLPTVWSNLLAGWILVGGIYNLALIPFLLLGGSFLYIGGMYLNDFCDANFDAQYCRERPIPAGKISRHAVRVMACLWFAVGFACLVPFGWITAEIALFLIAAIVLYDYRHKNVSWAPLVMGACRLLLYPLAASAFWSQGTVIGKFYGFEMMVFWVALSVVPLAIPLSLYVAGITYLARDESRPGKPTRWALLLLLLPIAMAIGNHVFRNSSYWPAPFMPILLSCLLQFSWMALLLVPFWRKTNPSLGRVVSGLLAGIVLVDIVVTTLMLRPLFHGLLFLIFLPLFFLALLLQRIVPAT